MTSPKFAGSSKSGRVYTWPNTGEEFTSVTNVLNALPKPALKYWAAKLVAEYAYDMRDTWGGLDRDDAVELLKGVPNRRTNRASLRGTLVHDAAEDYSRGRDVDLSTVPEEQRGYLAGVRSFLADFRPRFRYIEATVFSRRFGYAGTFDWCAEVDGYGLVIGDWKTSKRLYPDSALQLTAYRHADFIGLPDGRTEVPLSSLPLADVGLLVRLDPEGGYEAKAARVDPELLDTFQHAQGIRHWQTELEKTALTTALPPPPAEDTELVAVPTGKAPF